MFNNTKAPYNVSTPASLIAREALSEQGVAIMRAHVADINKTKVGLMRQFSEIDFFGKAIGGNHANFILIPVVDCNGQPSNHVAHAIYKALAEELGVVVRFRGMEHGCQGCLRITIGTPEEMRTLFLQLHSTHIRDLVDMHNLNVKPLSK